MPEDKIPLGWSNDPSCLLINMYFVGTEGADVSWRIEKELRAAKNVRVMLGDGQHTFILAGLTSRTEAMYVLCLQRDYGHNTPSYQLDRKFSRLSGTL